MSAIDEQLQRQAAESEFCESYHFRGIDHIHCADDDCAMLISVHPMKRSRSSSSMKAGGGMSSFRVLVVDDYEPFRKFVCSTLAAKPALRIVGEAADGLEAVRKSEKLQPDLIMLDVGLPSLNGIEAARRIRRVAPGSKILFVSQESSPDVVQEALSSGAFGYVVKAHAGRELLAAVDEVLKGKQYSSDGNSERVGSTSNTAC